ncbi:hypothetical protein BB558_000999 [Smittium angustum]|uniref:RNA polymerase II subunit A C-terminal domain phosphatase n=1 Tax=Smittium angustum TaxID=133377 RepID=A0A2U1JCN9_SMIAN|nr:hypothetical protein BB558_000999 [Smittium angustum]
MEKERTLTLPDLETPAIITKIKVDKDQIVSRGDELFYYEFKPDPEDSQESRLDSIENQDDILASALKQATGIDTTERIRKIYYSNYEGRISGILKREGDSVDSPNDIIIIITEPCTHEIQFNGLCSICGKDVTFLSHFGSDMERATVNMSYDVVGLMVSNEEAMRLEKENTERLLQNRKLSLILDLDQTLMHAYATEDSGFEKWLIDNYEGPQENDYDENVSQIQQKNNDNTSENEENTNISGNDTLKDSKTTTRPLENGTIIDPNKPKVLKNDLGVFTLPDGPIRYYIKMRPGLRKFLKKTADLFELHIYTMGTRNYAESVAKLIDPNKTHFKERILSRDESGSLTHKTIKRLFPCDDSMVVALDDRADVWRWSPNLIKVKQYAFFVGVGDINAMNLPQQTLLEQNIASAEEVEKLIEENLPHHKSKLVDEDTELENMYQILKKVHDEFYSAYDKNPKNGSSLQIPRNISTVPDILTEMRSKVLYGTSLVFSAVIPQFPNGHPPESSDMWRWAKQFGATITHEITEFTTHIVSNKNDTAKVNKARSISYSKSKQQAKTPKSNSNTEGNVSSDNNQFPIVVSLNWLLDSISNWSWQNEREYLLYPGDDQKAYKVYPYDIIRNNPSLKRKFANGTSKNSSASSLIIEGEDIELIGYGELEDELNNEEVDVSLLVSHVNWEDVDRELEEIFSDDDDDIEENGDYQDNENSRDNIKLGEIRRNMMTDSRNKHQGDFESDSEDYTSPAKKQKLGDSNNEFEKEDDAPAPTIDDAITKADARVAELRTKIAGYDTELVKFQKQLKGLREATIKTMEETNKVMKKQYKNVDIEKIYKLQDEMADIMDEANEIQELMGRSYNLPENIDEHDLDAELEALETEWTYEQENKVENNPSYLDDIKDTGKNAELDKELEEITKDAQENKPTTNLLSEELMK